MIVFSLISASFVIFLIGIYWYQTRSRHAELLNGFAQMKNFVPVFGHILQFSLKRDVLYKQFRELSGSFKKTFVMWGGIYGTVHIVSADDAEIILSNPKYISKGLTYEVFHSWLGTGLLTSTGAKWQQRRKMLTPAFHFNILQMFVDILGENSCRLIEDLKKECDVPKTDIVPFLNQTTLETICETSMGINLRQSGRNQKEYYDSLHTIGDCVVERIFSPWIHPDFAYYFSPLYWKQNRLIKSLHKFTSEIIQERVKTFKDSDITNIGTDDGRTKKRLAMLDLLIYANRHLGTIDYEGIREEVDTFVFEGHDTTSIALCCALTLFANHQDVQAKIIAEVDRIFGDSDRNATYDDLQDMKYLENCLKESLRLYPSVPYISRNLKEDVPLTNGTIPSGAEIFVHIYKINRDPKYYPDPEKFDPDRFLPENSIGRHPFAYIPFSAGPRNCIGQKFAILELKSIVSSIFRNFTLEPIDSLENVKWMLDFVLRIEGPIFIKIKSRSRSTN